MTAESTYPFLCWEDVEEGAALPGFDYELSLLRLVAYVRATGLYDFAHFDPDYARTVGAEDAFISTFQLAGLFSRLITDWAGPQCVLLELTFSMRGQMLRGEVLAFSGKVGRKFRGEAGEYLVELVDLNVATDRLPHAASATAVIALPSRSGERPAIARARSDGGLVEPNPEMPEFARAMIGVVEAGKAQPAWPLTREELHLWCEALEDWNPLYWDEGYAAQSAFGGLVAPPPSMFLGAGSSLDVSLGYRKPGAKPPEPVQQGLRGIELFTALRTIAAKQGVPFAPPGFPNVVVTQARFDFFLPLHVGDTQRAEVRLLDCSPLRTTRLGTGHFLAVETALLNQHGQLVKTFTSTMFFYGSA